MGRTMANPGMGLLGMNRAGSMGGGLLAALTAPRPQADAVDEMFLRRQAEREAMQAAPAPQPAPQQPPQGLLSPQRPRVSGWRVLDAVLGGKTISEGIDGERARLLAEPLRQASAARQQRLQGYVDNLSPDLQLAYEANPEKLGEALATRGEARVLNRGDVYTENGRPIYAAPFDAAAGSSVFDPLNPNAPIARAPSEAKVAGGALVAPDGRVLYRGPDVQGVAATADAIVTPEISQGQGGGAPQIMRSARPDAVTVAPGGEIVTFNTDGSVAGRTASTQARPMSDADQAAIARAELSIQGINTAVSRAQQLKAQIDNGELNLGPLTNMVSAGRNRTGLANENSLRFDALMNWAKEARDAILSANTGVQTDGDAVRALDRIISSAGDERVVRQALDRYIEASTATAGVFQRDIARRQGGAQNAGAVSVSSPQEAAALPPGTRYRAPNGRVYIRE